MVLFKGLLPALLALHGSTVQLSHALSIPTPTRGYASSERAAAIAEMATQIANGPRALTIGGDDYPMYHGPLALPGSLTEAIQLNETKMFVAMGSHTPDILASLATNMSAELTSYEAYTALYDAAEQFIEWPMSTDNSDETFGEQRVTVKAFALRKATVADLDGAELSLPDHELRKLCGRDADELFDDNVLFVEDYHDAAQYNDPERPDKYNPNVVGFFCVNKRSGKLLPVEIRLLDTELTYTARDTPEEWALAKMALEAVSSSYHQMQHMAETHAVTVPLRVEAYRTMGEDHPVRALLQRHAFMDFGLEKLAAMNLLNTSTLLDQIIGWGATGAARFLHAQTEKGLSVQHKAFYADIARRGLDKIDGHKFNAYAALYDDAIHSFVQAFVDAFYACDDAVVQDLELQNWANASAHIPHVHDFPTAFDTKEQLVELLAHLVFTCSVRHHGMNGQASWHGTSAPFAPAALWKPLPKTKVKKGDKPLDLLAYTIPPKVLPAMLAIASTFHRDVPESECYFSAYTSTPFSDEPKLAPAIKAFDKALQGIEETITEMERDETWPYLLLRPSQLPYYTWI